MKVINWKTTLGAFMVVVANVLGPMGIDLTPELQISLVSLGIFIIGIFAKDSNVTGGTKPNK